MCAHDLQAPASPTDASRHPMGEKLQWAVPVLQSHFFHTLPCDVGTGTPTQNTMAWVCGHYHMLRIPAQFPSSGATSGGPRVIGHKQCGITTACVSNDYWAIWKQAKYLKWCTQSAIGPRKRCWTGWHPITWSTRTEQSQEDFYPKA